MQKDPYNVLGLSAEAGPAEWKRAFRRLAMRWHPDRNGHPEAAERFREIRAAYDRLTTVNGENEGENGAPDDEAEGAAQEDPVARAADIRFSFELALEEAASGCTKTFSFSRGKACSTCDGSGESGMARTRFCAACHGSGRIRDAGRGLIPCAGCGGRGFFSERICSDCAGSGRETADLSLEISVPPGMLPGDELRLAGQGEPAMGELAAGDLYLTLIIRSHPRYQLRGRDLHFSMPVSALALIAGGEIDVPAPGGNISVRLAAGLPDSRVLHLAGKGYPGRSHNLAGDLFVTLNPVFPRQLDARQRKLLLQVDKALHENLADSLPEIAAWHQAT